MKEIRKLYADRIGGKSFGEGTTLFKFEKIKRAKRQAIIQHKEMALIDLGVGEPDGMADEGILDELNKQARRWENRGYADNGIMEFQQAAEYMQHVYGVHELIPEKEILHVIGTKSAYTLIPQAFINPGDIMLMTVPGYPVMGTISKWLGGKVYELPLEEKYGFLPRLDCIPSEVAKKAKLLYLNYPNNPTGAVATIKFYKEVIEFAKEHQIIVVQDAAYGALTFGSTRPLSFLSVPGAKEVGIEVHSLSKAFNMTGWRLGFLAGNPEVIKAIGAVKENNDCGQFKAIQLAGAYALKHPEITECLCEKYERRHLKLAKVLEEVGFESRIPSASFYEYIKIPSGCKNGKRFQSAEEFSEFLIQKAMISTVPWDEAGHYIRLSVTFVAPTLEEEDTVIAEIKQRLLDCQLLFE